MGPIALFDKSFLESLNVDESVMFDHFFLGVICPIFYVETLADLEKKDKSGRSPEKIVGDIAKKLPEMSGKACVHHRRLCLEELLGGATPMTGQVPIAGGRPVRVGGKTGIVFKPDPEIEAFNRWSTGDFSGLERTFARQWREQLNRVKPGSDVWLDGVIRGRSCESPEHIKAIVDEFLQDRSLIDKQINLVSAFLQAPPDAHIRLADRWVKSGRPLSEHAPYTAHVIGVDLFLRISMKRGKISAGRPSNWTDIAYLYYLPFCMVFVSSDRLHEKCSRVFLRADQRFVRGMDLKADLGRINAHLLALPESEREKGLMSFDPRPPIAEGSIVADLWGLFMKPPGESEDATESARTEDRSATLRLIEQMEEAPTLRPDEVDASFGEPDSLTLSRWVHEKRGSWFQLPKGLNDQ